jgi:hypothetical protein
MRANKTEFFDFSELSFFRSWKTSSVMVLFCAVRALFLSLRRSLESSNASLRETTRSRAMSDFERFSKVSFVTA